VSIMDDVKRAFDVMLHPGKATKKGMSIGEALKFYYMVMIIPLILGVIVSLALNTSDIITGVASAAYVIAVLVVGFPIGILVNAGIYHAIIGKLFKMYKGGYPKAVTAFTFGAMPSVLIYWLTGPLGAGAAFLRVFGTVGAITGISYAIDMVLSAIFGVWAVVVLIIALSNQMIMSRLKAFGTWLLMAFIVGVIVGVIVMIFAIAAVSTVGPGYLTTSCIAGPGYLCANMALSGNHLNFTFGQSTGIDWTGTILYAVPYNTTFSTSDGNDGLGNLATGQTKTVSIPVLNSGSSYWDGTIWAVYNVGNTTKEAQVATVTAMSG